VPRLTAKVELLFAWKTNLL